MNVINLGAREKIHGSTANNCGLWARTQGTHAHDGKMSRALVLAGRMTAGALRCITASFCSKTELVEQPLMQAILLLLFITVLREIV